MAVTRGQLRSAIRAQMKIDPRGKIWDDPEVNESITDAIDQISVDNDYKWEELKKTGTDTTVTDQQEYALPSDFVTLDLVRYDWNPLASTTYSELKLLYKTFPSGTPVSYYERDYKLGLSSIPTSNTWAIDYEYRCSAPVLTTDESMMIFRDNMKRTIVLAAAVILFGKYSDDKNITRTKNSQMQYERELSKAVKRNSLGDTNQIFYKTAYNPRTWASRMNATARRFGIY